MCFPCRHLLNIYILSFVYYCYCYSFHRNSNFHLGYTFLLFVSSPFFFIFSPHFQTVLKSERKFSFMSMYIFLALGTWDGASKYKHIFQIRHVKWFTFHNMIISDWPYVLWPAIEMAVKNNNIKQCEVVHCMYIRTLPRLSQMESLISPASYFLAAVPKIVIFELKPLVFLTHLSLLIMASE